MANTLTNLIPDFYRALDVVSRELSGFIPACTLDAGTARAAVGQNVRVPITSPAAAENVTPAQLPPDTGDQIVDNVVLQITKSRGVPFRWTGEEQRGLNNGGPGYLTIRQGQIAQALRTLVNEIEADMGLLYKRASRAYGTAGTNPFGNTTPSIADLAYVGKILTDNGCPANDRQLVIDTAAGVIVRQIPNLFKVNEAGETSLLRQGIIAGPIYGFDIRESAGVAFHTKGTMSTAYQFSATEPVGETSIAVDTGAGTVVAGDVLTFSNGTPADSEKYVVASDLSGGAVVINKPGLRSQHVDNDTFTLAASHRCNMAFHRSSMILAVRPPALPEEGDSAIDRTTVTDPRTGLTFELAMYPEFRRVRYLVSLAWGMQNIKPEHTALLLG